MSESDSGVYTCAAENDAGSASRQVRVVVTPRAITGPGVRPPLLERNLLQVQSGDAVEMRCEIQGTIISSENCKLSCF